jgi:hypothetical protein
MSVSQNGYRSRDYSLIASYTIVRDVKISLRKGDVSVVLLHFARWYDKNIEPLTKKDTGGYNPRTIPGAKVDSNHASGTAMDLRWNKHVRGKKNTFTAAQKAKINKQLAFYEGVIRWGENYKTATIDGMHYEINKPASTVAKIAKKCKEADKPPVKPTPPKPVPTTPAPTKPGTNPPGPKPPINKPEPLLINGKLDATTIRRWQQIMGTKVDGKIDKDDSELIRAVQKHLKAKVDHRLEIDGDLGPKTIRALQRYLKSPVDGVIDQPTSLLVKALQRRLNTGKF